MAKIKEFFRKLSSPFKDSQQITEFDIEEYEDDDFVIIKSLSERHPITREKTSTKKELDQLHPICETQASSPSSHTSHKNPITDIPFHFHRSISAAILNNQHSLVDFNVSSTPLMNQLSYDFHCERKVLNS